MKIKALRRIDNKEYIKISNFDGTDIVFTSDTPTPLANTATIEGLKEYYVKSPHIIFDNLELIELDVIESGVVGADIRNKLTPLKNLLALLKIRDEYEFDSKSYLQFSSLIKKQIEQCEISIKYLVNIL